MTPRHISLILNQRNFSTAEAHNPTAQDTEEILNVVRLLLSELQEHFLLRTKSCIDSTEITYIQQLCDSPKVTGNHQNSQDGFSGSRVGVVKPNITCSVQKPQAMQTITISRQQHPLPLALALLAAYPGASHSWGPQTQLKHFKTLLLLLLPAAAGAAQKHKPQCPRAESKVSATTFFL